MMVTDHWNFLERQKKESFFFDHSIQFSRFLWSKQGNHLIFIDNICPSPYMCSFRGEGVVPHRGEGDFVTPHLAKHLLIIDGAFFKKNRWWGMRGVQGACETPIMDLTLFDHFYGMKILQKFSSFWKILYPLYLF